VTRIIAPVFTFSHPRYVNYVAISRDFASGIGQPQLASRFRQIRDEFPTPEDINDNSRTAPSKRVAGVFPSYQRALEGTLAARAVGVERMRQECPHFHEWVQRLEALEPDR
jgi:hypothetical protein